MSKTRQADEVNWTQGSTWNSEVQRRQETACWLAIRRIGFWDEQFELTVVGFDAPKVGDAATRIAPR